MSEKKKRTLSRRLLIIIAIAIIALFTITGALAAYWQASQTPPPPDTNIPHLTSINFQYTDNRTNPNAPFLHITGTVTNDGNATANNCFVHATAFGTANTTTIDTTAPIASLAAGASQEIDVTFPYTGDALVAYNSFLEWTN